MTTPERFRRRQRVEGTLLLLLGVFSVLWAINDNAQDAAQERCINNYFAANSETSEIRSALVERESKAERDLLLNGTDVDSREEFQVVRARYVKALKEIDKARAENPVRPFPKERCE